MTRRTLIYMARRRHKRRQRLEEAILQSGARNTLNIIETAHGLYGSPEWHERYINAMANLVLALNHFSAAVGHTTVRVRHSLLPIEKSGQ